MSMPRIIIIDDREYDLLVNKSQSAILESVRTEVKNSKEKSSWIKSVLSDIDDLLKVEKKFNEMQSEMSFLKAVYSLFGELKDLRAAAKVTPEDTAKFVKFKQENKEGFYQLSIAKYADYKAYVECFPANLPKFANLNNKILDLQKNLQLYKAEKMQKHILSALESYNKAISKLLKSIAKSHNFDTTGTIKEFKGYYDIQQEVISKLTDMKFLDEFDSYLLEMKKNVDLCLTIIKPSLEEFDKITEIRQKAIAQYLNNNKSLASNPANNWSKTNNSAKDEQQKTNVLKDEIKLK